MNNDCYSTDLSQTKPQAPSDEDCLLVAASLILKRAADKMSQRGDQGGLVHHVHFVAELIDDILVGEKDWFRGLAGDLDESSEVAALGRRVSEWARDRHVSPSADPQTFRSATEADDAQGR